jgi:hypothetical protein
MRKLTIFSMFACAAFAQDQPPAAKPIAPEYMTLATALDQQMRRIIAESNAAMKRLEAHACEEANIPADKCAVNWQAGTVGVKPEPAKTATSEPSKN